MPQPQLIIFDFDGTLADSFPWFLSVSDDVAKRWGFRPIPTGQSQAMRQMSASAIFHHLGVPRWKIPLIAADMRRRMARDIHQIQLFAGVEPMLDELAANGAQLCIVSSNAADNIQQVMGPRLWCVLQGAECGTGLSAKHRRLTRLLRRARVDARDAIYIGDEIRDIQAARRAGLAAGAVTWGYNSPEVLARQRPDRLFEQVHEIVTALRITSR